MAKTGFGLGEIRAFLDRHSPGSRDLTPITEGEESQALAFVVDDQPLILRINADPVGFRKDRFAHDRFCAPSLPIPAIRLIAPIGTSFVCISDRAAGTTLQDLPPGSAVAYGAAVGATLDAMAKTDLSGFSGFGPFNAAGQGSAASWGAWLGEVADPERAGRLDRLDPPSRKVVAQAMEFVRRFAATVPDTRQLVHGDFGSNNVLCDNGRITAVIDWSEAMIGDPLYDVANILFWRSWLGCMEMQAAYFEKHEPQRLAQAETLLLYQTRIGLDTLRGALGPDSTRLREWALGRIATLLAHLDIIS